MPPIGRRTDGVLALAKFGGCAMPGRMLLLSFSVLVAAALLGSCLAALHLPTGKAMLPGWPLGLLHGLLGAAGLVMLLLALRGPPRGEAMGVGPFGRIAAVLLAMALLAGLAILRRAPALWAGSGPGHRHPRHDRHQWCRHSGRLHTGGLRESRWPLASGRRSGIRADWHETLWRLVNEAVNQPFAKAYMRPWQPRPVRSIARNARHAPPCKPRRTPVYLSPQIILR